MPTSFLSLPGELRQQIYKQVLLVPGYIDPFWVALDRSILLTPGLLCCHPAIRKETASLFYGDNHFDLGLGTAGDVASFLNQIGQSNASYVRHIRSQSPEFSNIGVGKIELDENSEHRLSDLQQYCPNLVSITTTLYSSDELETQLARKATPESRQTALQVLQARYSTWPYLRQITLELYENRLRRTEIRAQMQELGWKLITSGHAHEYGIFSTDDDWEGPYHDGGWYYDWDGQVYGDWYANDGTPLLDASCGAYGYHFDDSENESADSWVDNGEEDEDSADDWEHGLSDGDDTDACRDRQWK